MSTSSSLPVLDEAAEPLKIIQVAADTDPKRLALSIMEELRSALRTKEAFMVSLHAMGAPSVNNAVKATAIAEGYAAPMGVLFSIIPSFEDKEVGEGEARSTRTVMRMRLATWRVGG